MSLALPWLDALAPAAAPAARPRRRLVCINTPLGLHPPAFFPEKAGKDYALTPYMEVFKDCRDDFTVMSGLSHPDVGHSHDSNFRFLTAAPHPAQRAGFRNTISLDQLAADLSVRLIDVCSRTGGHIGAGLGGVELTVKPGEGVTVVYVLRMPSGDFLEKRTTSEGQTRVLKMETEKCDQALALCVPTKLVERVGEQLLGSTEVTSVELNAALPQDTFSPKLPEGWSK